MGWAATKKRGSRQEGLRVPPFEKVILAEQSPLGPQQWRLDVSRAGLTPKAAPGTAVKLRCGHVRERIPSYFGAQLRTGEQHTVSTVGWQNRGASSLFQCPGLWEKLFGLQLISSVVRY